MLLDRTRRMISRTPGLSELARFLHRLLGHLSKDFNSSEYWDRRYSRKGSSGSGSSDRLAAFKAETLNAFVSERGITSVIEFGSGDGNQLRLAQYPHYIGVDVSMTAIELTRSIFADDKTKVFLHTSEEKNRNTCELALSLDVIYHLVEDDVYEEYMERLFDSASRYVIIYSSNMDRRDAPHVRHRRFTDWVDAKRPNFKLIAKVDNPYPWDLRNGEHTSFADFFFYEKIN